jgi:hypothetical protein
MKVVAGVSLLALIGLTAPVFAGPVGLQRRPAQNQAAIAQLQASKDEVARQALMPTVKGPLRFCYMNKQENLDDLIDRLSNGRHVHRSEIERALETC